MIGGYYGRTFQLTEKSTALLNKMGKQKVGGWRRISLCLYVALLSGGIVKKCGLLRSGFSIGFFVFRKRRLFVGKDSVI